MTLAAAVTRLLDAEGPACLGRWLKMWTGPWTQPKHGARRALQSVQ
eukprot:CAMPEP_0114683092 /NCGR_PEP_ID=MMETSP0191-20121206/57461_1 /TAXON_ID=126664 /ORGANISM="Sorites sp." /LENGTH=45 /DNA_ID= /DNA_START= /DNA_END= /DNA_ORIENTATION=